MMKKLFAISCCMVFLLIASNAFADIVYRVKKGDTLFSISRQFDVSIEEIKRANNLTSSRLRAGAKLTIPIASYVNENADITYQVKKGDTLFSISRQFDVSIEEIKRANNLTSSRLRAGVKLTIPIASYVNVSHINENQEEASVDNGSAAHLSQEEIDKLVKSEDLQEMNLRDRVILFAKKMLGMPYRFGGNSSSGIDCSAYVQKVFRFVDIELPRTAREQFRAGEPISKEELSVGDLVFFRTYASFPSHVGIYLGNNLFIHASTGDRKVTITSLDTPYFVRRFIGAKRLIPEMY